MVPNVIVADGLTPTALSHCFAIPITHRIRGVLTRLCVVQTAGSLDGFTYALYCTAAACPPGPTPTQPANAPGYEVVPPLTVAAAAATLRGTWPADGVNHLWQPFSAAPDGRNGALIAQQQLYLLITCATAFAGKQFSCSLTLDDSVYT